MPFVAAESPFAAVVAQGQEYFTCARCFEFKEHKHVFCCPRCMQFSYCSRDCQRVDWNEFHKEECGVVTIKDDIPIARLLLRVLLRLRNKRTTPAFNGVTWSDINCDPNKLTNDARRILDSILSESLCKFLTNERIQRKQLVQTFAKVYNNFLEIPHGFDGRVIGYGMYIGLSGHKHKCVADAFITFSDNTAIINTYDSYRTNYSRNLTFCFINVLEPLAVRKKKLRELSSECQCQLCSSKEWDQFGQAMKCAFCGYSALLEKDEEFLVCFVCGSSPKTTIAEAYAKNVQVAKCNIQDPTSRSSPINMDSQYRKQCEDAFIASNDLGVTNFNRMKLLERFIRAGPSTGNFISLRQYPFIILELLFGLRTLLPRSHPLLCARLCSSVPLICDVISRMPDVEYNVAKYLAFSRWIDMDGPFSNMWPAAKIPRNLKYVAQTLGINIVEEYKFIEMEMYVDVMDVSELLSSTASSLLRNGVSHLKMRFILEAAWSAELVFGAEHRITKHIYQKLFTFDS